MVWGKSFFMVFISGMDEPFLHFVNMLSSVISQLCVVERIKEGRRENYIFTGRINWELIIW